MITRGAVEVGHRLEPGAVTRPGPDVTTRRVQPRRGRAQDDERAHVGAAVARGAPGRDVEAPAQPELDERRRHEQHQLSCASGDERRQPQVAAIIASAGDDRHERLPAQPPRLAGAPSASACRGGVQRAVVRGAAVAARTL